jgi:putative colanic acid biosynthesis UDP-glucose lipid carrier transferase
VPSIVLALMALLVLSPMLLAIAAAVKRSSPGPVLFRQRRCGLNGEEIFIYKSAPLLCRDERAY